MKNSILLGTLFLVLSCQSQVPETCSYPYQGIKPEDRCGAVTVPKSRDGKSKETTRIAYLVISSLSENKKKDPIVFLQGGPGGSVLELSDVFAQLNFDPDRDYILYDQRGIGFSEELCPELKTALLEIFAQDLDSESEIEALQKSFKSCKSFLSKDLREFSTTTNADDLEALRKHLGYEKLNLFGGSYGTRLGLKYMERYPNRVRSAVLSGLFPPEIRMYEHLFSNYDYSLNLLFETCEGNVGCNEKYPNLKSDFLAAFEALKSVPLSVPVTTGEVVINPQDMLLIVHQMLYSQDSIEQIPDLISAINQRNKEAIFPVLAQILPRLNIINIANYYSVMHGDEGGFDNELFLSNDTAGKSYLENGMSLFSADPIILNDWTSKQPKENTMLPVESDIPSLIISGEFDPVTPPQNGKLVTSRLKNGQHLVFEDAGHVPIDECFFQMAKEFLDTPYKKVNSQCLIDNDSLDWD